MPTANPSEYADDVLPYERFAERGRNSRVLAPDQGHAGPNDISIKKATRHEVETQRETLESGIDSGDAVKLQLGLLPSGPKAISQGRSTSVQLPQGHEHVQIVQEGVVNAPTQRAPQGQAQVQEQELMVLVDDIEYPINVCGVWTDAEDATVILCFKDGRKIPRIPKSKPFKLEFPSGEQIDYVSLGLRFKLPGARGLVLIQIPKPD